MRILLDHNTPAPLRYALRGHQVETAYERGWAELQNGDLIAETESAGFDLLITTDQGIRYQQNWADRSLALSSEHERLDLASPVQRTNP
jgi:hypothetical protein